MLMGTAKPTVKRDLGLVRIVQTADVTEILTQVQSCCGSHELLWIQPQLVVGSGWELPRRECGLDRHGSRGASTIQIQSVIGCAHERIKGRRT